MTVKLRLEEGKFYRTRDGRKVGPMKACGTSGAFFSNKGTMWYSNGVFYLNMPSEHDIVAEWTTKDDHIERTKHMIEVMQAYVGGEEIEFGPGANDSWTKTDKPIWYWIMYDYRIAETPDSINWDHVAPEFKYMARDENGNVGLFTDRPETCNGQWFLSDGKYAEAVAHASYIRGTVDWKDSLVARPGVEE